MDLNLAEQTDREIELFVLPALIRATGWKRIDCCALEGQLPGSPEEGKKFIVVYPELVSYTDRSHYNITEVWYKCRIESASPMDKTVDFFKNTVFPQLPFQPFKDEDAKNGHFSLKKNGEFFHLAFFVNPSYPEGRWCNHAIEDA